MEAQSVTPRPRSEQPGKRRRRLKPEVASRFVRAQGVELDSLYEKPVDQLTEVELRRMKAAFLASR